MQYQLVDRRYLLNMETFKFVSTRERKAGDTVYVPIYMQQYKDNVMLQRIFEDCVKVPWTRLNDLQIEFFNFSSRISTLGHEDFGFDRHEAYLKFIDKARGCGVEVNMTIDPYYGALQHARPSATQIRGVYYTVSVNGQMQKIRTDFMPMDSGSFAQIDSLARAHTYRTVIADKFYFGVRHQSYRVRYRGKVLPNRYIAMMCGSCGILLNSDFSFASIVLLKGASTELLDVERFLYTSNRDIVKFVTLVM